MVKALPDVQNHEDKRGIELDKVGITNLFLVDLPEVGKHDLVIHLDTEECSTCIDEVKKLGYPVEERAR